MTRHFIRTWRLGVLWYGGGALVGLIFFWRLCELLGPSAFALGAICGLAAAFVVDRYGC